MLNSAVNPAAPMGDRSGVRRKLLLATVLLGASLAPAMAQSPEVTEPAAPSLSIPTLSAPGAETGETAPALRAGSDAAPVGQGSAPVLAAPEGAAAPQPAAETRVDQPETAPEAAPVTAPEAATEPETAPEAAGETASERTLQSDAAPASAAPALPQQDERLPHDLSPIGMYMAADVIVKGVMIGLALASLVTWTVFVVKIVEIFAATRRAKRSIRTIRRAQTLQDARDEASRQPGPAAFMIREAAEEYGRSYPAVAEAGGEGIKERVGSALGRIEAQAVRRMQRGTGLLASIGSVAPFVGLFGTVWGIMNSFIGIAETQTTNLAVVAPGIAEALLATAIGLVAAIPAVIFYNGFARAVTGYRQKLVDASAGIERLVSRDLDFRIEPRAPGRR